MWRAYFFSLIVYFTQFSSIVAGRVYAYRYTHYNNNVVVIVCTTRYSRGNVLDPSRRQKSSDRRGGRKRSHRTKPRRRRSRRAIRSASCGRCPSRDFDAKHLLVCHRRLVFLTIIIYIIINSYKTVCGYYYRII